MKDISGLVFGRWTVLSFSHRKGGSYYWNCRCECGTVRVVVASALSAGASKSCGCIPKGGSGNFRHGYALKGLGASEYTAWCNMRRRCHSPNEPGYRKYGAKGISVCDSWRDSFENFLADMGPKPSPRHSIDRIDVYGNYEPSNCRWATPEVQDNNKRNSRYYEFNGRKQTEAQWARELRISHMTLYARRRRGWTVEKMLQTPKQIQAPHTTRVK